MQGRRVALAATLGPLVVQRLQAPQPRGLEDPRDGLPAGPSEPGWRPLPTPAGVSIAVQGERVAVQRRPHGRFRTIPATRVNGTAPRLRLRVSRAGNHVIRIAYRAGRRLHVSRPPPVLVRPVARRHEDRRDVRWRDT